MASFNVAVFRGILRTCRDPCLGVGLVNVVDRLADDHKAAISTNSFFKGYANGGPWAMRAGNGGESVFVVWVGKRHFEPLSFG